MSLIESTVTYNRAPSVTSREALWSAPDPPLCALNGARLSCSQPQQLLSCAGQRRQLGVRLSARQERRQRVQYPVTMWPDNFPASCSSENFTRACAEVPSVGGSGGCPGFPRSHTTTHNSKTTLAPVKCILFLLQNVHSVFVG